MSKRTVYMGTTGISPESTASEIHKILVRAKVQHINNEYSNGEIVAIRFAMQTPTGETLWFKLPVRWEPVLKFMKQNQSGGVTAEQAKRTAWRQILRWVEAQMALIEVQSSTAFEVFLPYMQNNEGRTVAELFSERHSVPLLPPGTSK